MKRKVQIAHAWPPDMEPQWLDGYAIIDDYNLDVVVTGTGAHDHYIKNNFARFNPEGYGSTPHPPTSIQFIMHLKAGTHRTYRFLDDMSGTPLRAQEHGSHDQKSHGRRGGKSSHGLSEVSPEKFAAALDRARETSPHAQFVSPVDPKELRERGARTYLTENGGTGYFMNPDGYVGGVFSDGSVKGAGQRAMLNAVENGATKLDCYDGFLPKYYSQFGFKVTGRNEWNADYAPDNWNYERDGKPDYVDMEWDGGDRSTVANRFEKGKPLKGGD